MYSITLFGLLVSRKGFGFLRELLVQGESVHIGASYPLCCSMLFYLRDKKIVKGRKFIILLIIVLAVISTSKQFILLTFLYLVPWYKKYFKLKIKFVLFIIFIGLISFMFMHILIGHISLENTNAILSTFLKQFNGYFIGSLASFQLHLDGLWEAAGIPGAAKGWVKAGNYIGNTHTAFRMYYNDKSIFIFSFYVLGIACIYSFIHSKNTVFHNFMKIYAVFPLYMLFFADLMFKSMWFTFGLAGLGISFIGNSRTNEKYLFTHNHL